MKSAGGASRRALGREAGYQSVNQKEADEVEMGNLGADKDGQYQVSAGASGQVIRPHEIYDNTNYIPNSSLRLLNIPMNSSLAFQKLLWFHSSFDVLYLVLMLGASLHKVSVIEGDPLPIWVASLMLIWAPLEFFRVRIGYSGNINETFPELIAFMIFTGCFILPISVVPLFQSYLYPHEAATIFINLAFVFCELVVGSVCMWRFMSTNSAAFFLRTAPIIDKTFEKKFAGSSDIMSTREIQLGMQKFDKARDALQPFKESDRFINRLGV